MKFSKPATSIDDQIRLLRRRGMIVDDDDRARHYLKHISYYRLRAYWLPFEVPAQNGDHAFRAETNFEDILNLYVFDRQLRLLVLDATERVEVTLRAQWAHHMAMKYRSHGYLDQALYSRRDRHASAVTRLTSEFNLSRDTFAKHYRSKYNNPNLPPVWMAAEIISFGQLSKWIYNLKLRADRQAIAKPFSLDEKALSSFVHHMSYVRNICAHHGRLWNKRFTVTMAVPKFPAKLPVVMRGADDRKVYNTLVMLDYLLSMVAPDTGWRERLVTLIDEYPLVDPADMGFPTDWKTRPSWKVGS
jgi:abortive infection bacteriophage resistance protein